MKAILMLWIFGALLLCATSCTQAPPGGEPRVGTTAGPARPGGSPAAATTMPSSPAAATTMPSGRPGRETGQPVPPPPGGATAVPMTAPSTHPRLDQCASNLRDIGTALGTFATDNGGRFPKTLESLQPKYLKNVPTCPVAGADTYSGGYASAASPDAYTVVCSGTNHPAARLPANFPQYSSKTGLVRSP